MQIDLKEKFQAMTDKYVKIEEPLRSQVISSMRIAFWQAVSLISAYEIDKQDLFDQILEYLEATP